MQREEAKRSATCSCMSPTIQDVSRLVGIYITAD
jgi:hypothetical protein